VLAPTVGFAQQPEPPVAQPAAPVEPPRPRLMAARTDQPPTIDGDVRDAAWQRATPTTAFTQKFPDEAQPPSEPTTLRVLYDDSALYIAFDCVQRSSSVIGRLARRDRQVEADWVQVAISDGSNTYEFSVNAAGVLSDGVRFNDTDYSADWDGVWESQVARDDRGWSAEIRIPLLIFRHSIGVQDWGFQARRYISQRQETDEWAFIPRSVAGEVSHYGALSGFVGVHRSNALELLPYATMGTTWADLLADGRTLGALDVHASAGLDLVWHIGKDLTLDASFNPDFAQVEADQVVLNLTTYETFVPEKRPFFVSGLALFQLPRMELYPSSQTLFYTRRIGSVPDAPVAADGAAVSAPQPSTIYAAAKLSGQLASGVTAGFVSAVTGRNDVAVQPVAGPSHETLAEPLAFANVARVKLDITDGASLGVLATALQRFEPARAYPTLTQADGSQLEQCPDGTAQRIGARCFHDSYVAEVDGGWRSASGTYVAAGHALVTTIQHGPPRTMADGTVIRAGDTSPAGRVYLAKEGGQWLGSLEVQAIGRRVDYNDLGYLQRQNQVRVVPYLAYRTLDPFWEIAETQTYLSFATRDNLDGTQLLRAYIGGSKVRFKNFWIATADVFHYDVQFEDREVGDGTTLQYPTSNELDLSLSTDPRRQLAASIATESELYRGDGGRFVLNGELTYQPLPQLELQLLPQLTFTSGQQRFIAGDRAVGEPALLFGALEARAAGATLRTSYTFTNRLTLQLYGQLLLASKHYSDFHTYGGTMTVRPVIRLDDLIAVDRPAANPDSAETSLNISAVLRWEFRAGSTLFLVYSRFQDPQLVPLGDAKLDLGALRNGPASNAIRLKLSYYWN
jgi:hypothetical protein